MGRKSTRQEIVLSDEERACLEGIASNPRSLRKHVWRARIVPEPGSGRGPAGTMRRTGVSKPTVRRRRDRFLALGVDGLLRDATRPPGKKPTPDGPGDVAAPAACPAPDGAGAGREAGDGLHGILKENGLGPHRVGTFRVSRDVVGLCIDPPDHAVGLPVDESEDANATGPGERANRIQALGRTQEAPARDAGPCRDKDARPACSRPATSPPAPLAGVPRLPRPCRRGDRTRNPGACHPRQRTPVPMEPEDLVEACKGGYRKLRKMASDV